MIGAIALISLFAFMKCAGTILTYLLYICGSVKIRLTSQLTKKPTNQPTHETHLPDKLTGPHVVKKFPSL